MINCERGQVLPLALMALAIGALVTAPFLGYSSSGLISSKIHQQAIDERYAADAGAEYAIWRLRSGGSSVPQFALNNRTVNVTIADQGEQVYSITSTATGDDGSSTTIESYVLVSMFWLSDGYIEENIEGDVYVNGDILLDENVIVDGSAYATGNIILDNNSEVTGDVVADGDIILNNLGIIGGSVSAGGDLTLGNNSEIGSIEVIGNVCAVGNITIYNDAIVNGNVYTSGNLELSENTIIRGDVYITGDIVRIIIVNNASIEGNIYITGSITDRLELGNNGVITGAVYATGDINNIIHEENVLGGVYYPDERGNFDGWQCPQMPAGESGINIQSWEVMRQQS